MERLSIILAVLVCVAAGTAVIAMTARSRRAPLRMDSEVHEDDEHLLLGPIDRSTEVIEGRVIEGRVIEGQVIDGRVTDAQITRTEQVDAERRIDAPLEPAPAGARDRGR